MPRSVVVLGLIAAGCGSPRRGVLAHLDDHYPERLSEWRLFQGELRDLRPNQGVLPYEVTTPLFSNNATKFRTVWMPAGTRAAYSASGVFDLPVGAILTKTFSFGRRHVETRIFIHKRNGWAGVTYVWMRDQSDAVLDVTPQPVRISWEGQSFDYEIPNVNQCKVCHEGPNDNGPLGISARMLNRDGQLQQWIAAGYLDRLPAEIPVAGTDLDSRARDYLEINCATCHVAGGRATKSGLFLSSGERDPGTLGICRPEAGSINTRSIVPGKPERSRLLDRMESLEPKFMMPDLGRSVIDDHGVKLIRDWIASLPGTCRAG